MNFSILHSSFIPHNTPASSPPLPSRSPHPLTPEQIKVRNIKSLGKLCFYLQWNFVQIYPSRFFLGKMANFLHKSSDPRTLFRPFVLFLVVKYHSFRIFLQLFGTSAAFIQWTELFHLNMIIRKLALLFLQNFAQV